MVGLLSFGINPAATFQGNPNVTISAINTTGGIVVSRSSGSTPMFVQVSASAITATGTSAPYEDLEYFWNFGDSSGTETIVDPYTGNTVNLNTSQTGPEATYVYRSASGSPFTITLTIRGQNGGSFTTAQTTTSVTVSAFSASGGDLFFDSVNGLDTNNGTSSATPKQTWTAVQTAVAGITSNYRINLAKGSSWTSSTGIDFGGITLSHLRINSYGSGASPVVSISSGSNAALTTQNGGSSVGHAQDDIVVSGINFQTTGTWDGNGLCLLNATGNASAAITNLYCDNCTFSQTVSTTSSQNNVIDISCGQQFSPLLMANTGFWFCNVNNPATTSTNTRMGLFYSAMNWGFVVGSTFSGVGTSTTFDHHIYPLMQTHLLFRYNTFNAAGGKLFALNCDWNSISGGNEIAQYWLLSDNLVAGPLAFHDASDGTNDTQVVFQNFVNQRNRITNLTNPACTFFGGQSMTFRDLRCWNNSNSIIDPNGTTTATYKVYRNYIYSATGSNILIDMYNNGSPAYTSKHVITDNKIQDMRTSSETYSLGFTNQSGATIDRNTTYAPNDSDAKFFSNAGVDSSFAQWQAAGFDPNGNTINPGFVNPAAGIF